MSKNPNKTWNQWNEDDVITVDGLHDDDFTLESSMLGYTPDMWSRMQVCHDFYKERNPINALLVWTEMREREEKELALAVERRTDAARAALCAVIESNCLTSN
tara:strand:+ start:213 stop:521 length:309 start_codon:yes stop_codon:yes gene_type:complete